MTTTLTSIEIAEAGTTQVATARALALLGDAATTCAELDPDLLHSTTVAGRAVVCLASLARSAAAALGACPGPVLRDGPGVVVVRDLVRAATLLESAASGPRGDDDDDPSRIVELVASMESANRAFRAAVSSLP